MVREEEIMGLYALARDELEGVTKACEKLEKTIQRLERIEGNVETYAKTGIRASLIDFQNKFDTNLCQSLSNASKTLENAVDLTARRLDRLHALYLVGCFLLGVLVGLMCLGWWMWDRMTTLESYQVATYRELVSQRPTVKPQKTKVKQRRKEPTQSSAESNAGEGLVGKEEETK